MPLIWRWMSGLSLWPRMALTISLGFVVLFGAFAALSNWALQDSTDRIRDERLVVAELTATRIDGLLLRAIAELEQAPRFFAFDSASTDLAAETELLTNIYGQVGDFASGTALLSSSGRVILSHPPDLYARGTDLSMAPHVSLALARHETTISEPFRDPRSQRPVVAVSIPMEIDGRLWGLVSGLVDISGPAIERPLRQAATIGHTGHAALVDRDGRVLASTLALPFLSPGEHVTFYRQAMARNETTVEVVPFELDLPGETLGELHLMAFVPLKVAPWGVAVGGDYDETFAAIRRLQVGLVILGIIVLAGVWAATLVGARRLVRPIHQLTDDAQRIADGSLQTPLEVSEGGEIGNLASALERMRRQLLANIAELADWNETLETRVAAKTEELREEQALTQRLLRRAISAQEEERARLARELHDEVGQMLTAVELGLERLIKSLPADNRRAHKRLNSVRSLTEQTLVDLRRIIMDLRPGVLDQLGLIPALVWMSDHTLRPLGVQVTFDKVGLAGRLSGEIETILFRIAQEAMSNVARHSRARHLLVSLQQENGRVLMTMKDDGQGCDLALKSPASDRSRGLGLAGMQERASLAGGQVTVESAPGQGTTIRTVVPLPAQLDDKAGPNGSQHE